MSQHDFLSLIVRMIPEAFLLIYSIYILTNTKVYFKKIFISSILGGLGVYIIRLLPVHFGVHTIISVMLYIVLAVKINNIEMFKAMATTLVAIIIIFISDLVLVFVYTNIFQLSSELLFGESWISALTSIPSLILFYLIVKFIAFFREKRNIK